MPGDPHLPIPTPASSPPGLDFEARGAMGNEIRRTDWSATPLGDPRAWPVALKTLVGVMASSHQPMFVAWGPTRTLIYNDRYVPLLGRKHPGAMGRPFFDVWHEAHEVVPLVERVFAGEAVHMDDLALTLERGDRPEEAHFAFSYTPVRDEDGTVLGLFCPCNETTEQVRSSRRLEHERRRQRHLLQRTPGFVAVLRSPGHVHEYVNDAFCKVFGPHDYIGREVVDVFPELREQRFIDTLDRVYRTGEAFGGRGIPLRLTDRPVRFIDVICEAIRDDDGRIGGVFVGGYDVTETHEAAEALRRSEAALMSLNANLEREVAERTRDQSRTWRVTPDLLSVTDGNGVFESTNPAWHASTGWSAEALRGVSLLDRLHPDDRADSEQAIARACAGIPVLRLVNRFAHADGGWRWLSWMTVLEAGKLYHSARDVTDNRRRDEELARRTADHDRIWRLSRDLLVIIGPDGVFRAVSPAWTTILGHAPEDVVGSSFERFVWPDDTSRTRDALVDAGDHDLTSFENRYRHRDGTPRWISWSTAVEGDVVYAYGRDVTAERESSIALSESQARLRTIFETSFQLQGLLSPAGVFLDANTALLAALASPLDDVVGHAVWQTAWFASTAGMPERIHAAFDDAVSGADFRSEVTVQLRDQQRTFDLSMRAVRDDRQAVVAVVLEAVDVTERRDAEAQLRQSQKMEAVGQLTGGLAHDFNNLLTGISGSLELLQTRVTQGRLDNVDRYIAAASGAARRAAGLTHRLLAFSRRQTLDPKPIEVFRLVGDLADLIRRTVGPLIEVEVVGAAGQWLALVDGNQLENAVLNLCINARDAMPDGGRLTIETSNEWLDARGAHDRDLPEGQYVVLGVTDTGSGMSPEVVQRAFDPFFTTKPLGTGTGLGLSMVYGFARQSGGQARIYSEAGQGTTMRIYLPRYLGQADGTDEPVAEAEAPRAAEGQAVLIVDDEDTVRMLVVEVLEELGYAAIQAADGPSGLKVLQSNARIDLLITDVGLPGGMNGRQLGDAARALRPELNILYITGYAENAVLGNGQLGSGMQVLTKPFAIDALARRIGDLLPALS